MPVIAVKKNACAERKRFILTYELGHLVLEVRQDVDTEKAANRFAGAVLMPAEALGVKSGERRTDISLG